MLKFIFLIFIQVKKEVLDKLGLAVTPGMLSSLSQTFLPEVLMLFVSISKLCLIELSEKSSEGPKSIAAFFSKRCLPPGRESVKPGETSPLPSLKSSSAAIDERPQSSYNV